jgi:hypothetical protein
LFPWFWCPKDIGDDWAFPSFCYKNSMFCYSQWLFQWFWYPKNIWDDSVFPLIFKGIQTKII